MGRGRVRRREEREGEKEREREREKRKGWAHSRFRGLLQLEDAGDEFGLGPLGVDLLPRLLHGGAGGVESADSDRAEIAGGGSGGGEVSSALQLAQEAGDVGADHWGWGWLVGAHSATQPATMHTSVRYSPECHTLAKPQP